MSTIIRRTDYDSGDWRETEELNGRSHGATTTFRADGSMRWRRQYQHGVETGVACEWDEAGRLIRETPYAHGVRHGPSQEFNPQTGDWRVTDFEHGRRRGWLEAAVNEDFRRLIRPHFGLESIQSDEAAMTLLDSMAKPASHLGHKPLEMATDPERGSFWGRVTILGADEAWPEFGGRPLSPALQIACSEIPSSANPFEEDAWITVFAAPEGERFALGEDIVLRRYRRSQAVRDVAAPSVPALAPPAAVAFSEPRPSYPSMDDLPPRLSAYLEVQGLSAPDDERAFESKIGGWPSWLQSGTIYSERRFLFQLDSLSLENWRWGDASLNYFLESDVDPCAYLCEMC